MEVFFGFSRRELSELFFEFSADGDDGVAFFFCVGADFFDEVILKGGKGAFIDISGVENFFVGEEGVTGKMLFFFGGGGECSQGLVLVEVSDGFL